MRSIASSPARPLAEPPPTVTRGVKPWLGLVALALSCSPWPAWGQVTPLDRLGVEQERLRKLIEGKPKAYEDRFIESAVADSPANPTAEAPGVPPDGQRSTMIEARTNLGQSRDEPVALRSAQELGIRLLHRRETLNHGEWIMEADWRQRQGDADTVVGNTPSFGTPRGQRLTLRNLGLPLTEQWFADSVAGDFTAEITDALARSSRASLGGSVVRGIGARLYTPGVDIRLGQGRLGASVADRFPASSPMVTPAWPGSAPATASTRAFLPVFS